MQKSGLALSKLSLRRQLCMACFCSQSSVSREQKGTNAKMCQAHWCYPSWYLMAGIRLL